MSSDNSLKECFEEALSLFNFSLPSVEVSQFIEYQNILSKWNQTTNLTAHRSYEESIEKNFIDSIAVSKFIEGETVLDFGSGAGFPGLVLAVLHREKKFFLLEADQKKASFLKFISAKLSLLNVKVIPSYAKIENPTECFPRQLDMIVSRATVSPAELSVFASSNLEKSKKLLMMLSDKQFSSLKVSEISNFDLVKSETYILPWCKIKHHALNFQKK